MRNALQNRLPQPRRRQQQKNRAREKHRTQRRLPRHMHLHHDHVAEVRVQPHARRQRQRIARNHSHQNAAERRGDAGRRRHRRNRQSRFAQNRGIHHDDVSHRDKRRQPGEDLRLPGSLQPGKIEIPFQSLAHGLRGNAGWCECYETTASPRHRQIISKDRGAYT